jgi:hypothetical protein
MTDETAELRGEVNRLQRQLVEQAQDFAITSGRCIPAERERFKRRYGDKGTLADWNDWLRDAPRPPAHSLNRQQARRTGTDSRDTVADARPDSALVALTLAEMKQSGTTDYFAAQRKVLRANAELANRYRYMPGEA